MGPEDLAPDAERDLCADGADGRPARLGDAVRSADGAVESHAIRPLDDADTFVHLVLDLPDLVGEGPRESVLYRETTLHEWVNSRYWTRQGAEEVAGPETWFPE